MQPWLSVSRFEALRADVEQLVAGMQKYKTYLEQHCEAVQAHHRMVEVQPPTDTAVMTTIQASSDHVPEKYKDLDLMLGDLAPYQTVFLNDLAPEDRYERREWLSQITLPSPTMVYRCAYGNQIGTQSYIFRIPDDGVDQTCLSCTLATLAKEQPHYSTRALRQDYLNKYNRLCKLQRVCCETFIEHF